MNSVQPTEWKSAEGGNKQEVWGNRKRKGVKKLARWKMPTFTCQVSDG